MPHSGKHFDLDILIPGLGRTLLLIDHAALLATYRAPQTVEALIALGARFIGLLPPGGALLAPGGTACFLAQWLAWQE
jgi:hypothetical protein